MKTAVKVLFAVAVLISFLLLSCKKESSADEGKQMVNVYLTDNPVNFQQVNVDIQKLELKIEVKDSAGVEHEFWEVLTIRPGVYNLLNFRNGIDTLFATGFVTRGEVKKIRITLGGNNSIMVNGLTLPLTLKDAVVIIDADDITEVAGSGIKIHLDFDAAGSINLGSNGLFELLPHIRTFSDDHDGRIEGKILPAEAGAVVVLKSSSQTLMAIPEDDGKFKIRGIKAGTVDLFIDATANGYKDTTIKNISIGSKEIKLPAITLQK
ncbi:MAG: DUF4382 domain-containing protein [Lacibacter sp.]